MDQAGETLGAVTLGIVIQRIRSIFKYASDDNLIDRIGSIGQNFKRPNKKRAGLGPPTLVSAESMLFDW